MEKENRRERKEKKDATPLMDYLLVISAISTFCIFPEGELMASYGRLIDNFS